MFFSLKADTTANDKEATAYQSGAVEDHMGPAPHHTEAAADLAKAATDQTGAAADQIGAPAVQTEASADQAALVDDQTGAPVVQTEASEAGDDKPGAAVEHHGAIADQGADSTAKSEKIEEGEQHILVNMAKEVADINDKIKVSFPYITWKWMQQW